MASPVTPSTSRPLSITPDARVLKSPLSDETIWSKLKDVGFDEESIKRRDKASLIAYIAKLETEIFDTQHHMGLLIMEKRELEQKYEQVKDSAEAAELARKRDHATHLSSLAEANKREEKLKKALGVEKECIASIEKTLHEMRAESAETKVAAEVRLAEARSMTEEAQKKILDAEAKFRTAEALQAEASRFHRSAERKLQEVEAREEDLKRHMNKFKSDCEAKERDISLERQALNERQKTLQQDQERMLASQALMNQREDLIASKSQELNQVETELESMRTNLEMEKRAVCDEKSKLDLKLSSFSQREEILVEREALLVKREQDLLIFQEKLASKESVGIQNAIAHHETELRRRKSEFESELEMKRKLVEDELDAKRRTWELREVDLNNREDFAREKEHDLEVQSRMLSEKDKELVEMMNALDEKERHLTAVQKDIELKSSLLMKEKEETMKIKLGLQKSRDCVEDEKKHVYHAKEKLETMKNETSELSVLEMKLKEEIDLLRAQKLELVAEEDRLKVEKAKFESEWESIDEKRAELRRDADLIAQKKESVSKLLKDERDSIKLEKEAIIQQHKQDLELLNREREEFMNKMLQERSELFSNLQKEHADFLLGLEMQKREIERSVEKRREEIEAYLQDKEKAFELEKSNELENIRALKEKAEKELEQVGLEMRKLDNERIEINQDRERRDKEWSVLNKLIEELKDQTYKLEQQRQLLQLERLENLKLASESREVDVMQQSKMYSSDRKLASLISMKDNPVQGSGDKFLEFKHENDNLKSAVEVPPTSEGKKNNSVESHNEQSGRLGFAEPRIILEVPTESEMIMGTHEAKRKRIDHSGSEDHPDLEKDNKKQRHKAELSDDAINQCVSSTPESGIAEVTGAATDVQIIDKIIRITEVTCEVTSTKILANQEPLQSQEQDGATAVCVTVEAGGSNGHKNSAHTKDGLPNTVQVSDMSKGKHLTDAGDTQLVDSNTSKNHDPKVEESGTGKSDNGGEVTQTVAMGLRSRQKRRQQV